MFHKHGFFVLKNTLAVMQHLPYSLDDSITCIITFHTEMQIQYLF